LGEERELVEEASLLALSSVEEESENPYELDTRLVARAHELGKMLRLDLNSAGKRDFRFERREVECRSLGDIAAQVEVAPESIYRIALYSAGVYCVAHRSERKRLSFFGDLHSLQDSHEGSVHHKELVTFIANAVKVAVAPAPGGYLFEDYFLKQYSREEDASQFGAL
jgi:hypothetical protein